MYIFQNILDFSLLLKINIKNITVENLLDNYFSFEKAEFIIFLKIVKNNKA